MLSFVSKLFLGGGPKSLQLIKQCVTEILKKVGDKEPILCLLFSLLHPLGILPLYALRLQFPSSHMYSVHMVDASGTYCSLDALQMTPF